MSHNSNNNLALQNSWFSDSSSKGMPPHPPNFNNISNFPSSSSFGPQDPMSQHLPPHNVARTNSFEPQQPFSSMNMPYGQNFNALSHNLQPGVRQRHSHPPAGYPIHQNNAPFNSGSPSQVLPQNISNNRFNIPPPPPNHQFGARFPFEYPPPFNNNFQPFNQNYRPTLNNEQPQPSNPYPSNSSNYTQPYSSFQQNSQQFNSPNVQFSKPPSLSFHTPPPTVPSVTQKDENASQKLVPDAMSEKEMNLVCFLKKFYIQNKVATKSNITIPEFRSSLQQAFLLSSMLRSRQQKLRSLLNNSDEEWEKEMEDIAQIKNQLSALCEMVSSPSNISDIQRKLKLIKKKRELKQKLKHEAAILKLKKEQERELLSQEIDKWLDTINEKNLKEKREIEMKKEADIILSEVRRKIQEGKKTLEKLKMFEKLRQVRQANAEKKGLFSTQDQNTLFESKMSQLRSLMQSQLHDYENEEKALKVMLEEEQGGRREEEVVWKIQRAKNIQERKKKNIEKCLFGDAEEPSPEDPLFLFFQFHNSGNSSIDSLVSIRHQWDMHLSDEGESIPHQWVVPVPPSNISWEEAYNKD